MLRGSKHGVGKRLLISEVWFDSRARSIEFTTSTGFAGSSPACGAKRNGVSVWDAKGTCNASLGDRYPIAPPINAVVAQRKSIRLSSGRLGCRDSSTAPNTKSIQDKSRCETEPG